MDAFCDVNCYHEQQWFAPVDFDFDCMPIERECGYYFSAEKLSWATSGERVPVGSFRGGQGAASPSPVPGPGPRALPRDWSRYHRPSLGRWELTGEEAE